ncbi:zinc ribbon domain-containing protein [Aestuariimicrobium ganziense]|uniref:zinc ribbon domain-containing protein n=1 Tax=Aestuariimicrobium ganziense TaxID=2773677 RepID=UPI0019432065|nr:DUF6510 family protein [Aestuariimicrobium ganziense]
MQAAPGDQRRLLDLAGIDTSIAQATHRRATLPVLATLADLGRQRSLLSDELTAANARLSDVEVDQERLESDLTPARERLVRNQQRVDAGAITDPKALSGMLDEIEHLKVRIAKLEDDELEVMQVIEDLTSERDAIAARRAEVDATGREQVAVRNAHFAKIDTELAELATERDLTAKDIPAELIDLYERLRARIGSGAAALADGRCTGCQLEATLADLRRYNAAPADEVLRCEECGRILVRPATA